MNNNNDFFLKQMRGVTPIKKNNKIKKEDRKVNYKSGKKNIVQKPENSNGPSWTLVST